MLFSVSEIKAAYLNSKIAKNDETKLSNRDNIIYFMNFFCWSDIVGFLKCLEHGKHLLFVGHYTDKIDELIGGYVDDIISFSG